MKEKLIILALLAAFVSWAIDENLTRGSVFPLLGYTRDYLAVLKESL